MITDNDALRAALLDVLIEMPAQHLATQEGRMQLIDHYQSTADMMHPAVAQVFMEAAEKLKGD